VPVEKRLGSCEVLHSADLAEPHSTSRCLAARNGYQAQALASDKPLPVRDIVIAASHLVVLGCDLDQSDLHTEPPRPSVLCCLPDFRVNERRSSLNFMHAAGPETPLVSRREVALPAAVVPNLPSSTQRLATLALCPLHRCR
jgi:hypothetical protein